MTVIADYSISAGALALGRAAPDGMRVELVQVLEDDGAPVAYFWTWGGSDDQFQQALADQGGIEGVRAVDATGDRQLYRGECSDESETLLADLLDNDGIVLEAVGDDEAWSALFRFPRPEAFRAFQRETADEAVTVESVYGAAGPSHGSATDLTERQRETLQTAYREGYFDIPRKITLVDLAGELGVSDQAVSERLRRGEAKLVSSQLFEE